jgi:hypothetical protein
LATDATGTPTTLGIPTYNINVDAPSGNGFNAAMAVIDSLIQARAPLASPAFTGTPTAPTPVSTDNTTKIATTAFVKAQGYATLASPALTGTPTAPTAASTDNSTLLATTAFVKSQGYLTSAPVTTVFGRAGAVVAASGDYTAAMVTNAADLSSAAAQVFTGLVQANGFKTVVANNGLVLENFFTGADTSPSFKIFAQGAMTWSAGGATSSDLEMARNAAGILQLTNPAGGSAELAIGDGTHTGVVTGFSGGPGLVVGAGGTKAGFFGATPVTQPGASQVTLGSQIGTAFGWTSDSTATGNVGTTKYTIGDIVAALKNLGLIAS